ncbi:type IV secretion system protein VirB6 [Novosphingobium sp. SG751A]|uniref:type IV secretion system protein n=1 Tax=Novosphingobium sp. SG751A TaxID=2587000 RepID=UPI0015517E81|nr:type IV secretion system protein [Novosphingobium sp. SG751A]NOW46928.1 type IV secretion system protein VirB6 [Novosphingobium sp. SG751A]
MMGDCGAFDPSGPYVGGVLALADCRALGLAQDGWRALSGGAWLTAALTIAVALIGYRLMLGQARGRDGLMLALRIGGVLALTTQWPTWEVVAYRLGIEGPESLALSVIEADGSRYGLAARFDRIAGDLDEVLLVDGVQTAEDKVQPGGHVLSSEARGQVAWASAWLTGAALAGLMAPRLVIALLLGLGPLFTGALLLAGAQGLFVGWLRACAGAMLAAVAGAMVLGLELAVIGPQVAGLLGALGGDGANAMAGRIAAGAGLFAALLAAVALGVMRAAWAIRLPRGAMGETFFSSIRHENRKHVIRQRRAEQTSTTRAQQIAQITMRSLRREEMYIERTSERAGAASALLSAPLGQSGGAAGRRMRRISGAARNRDGAGAAQNRNGAA